MKKLENPIRGLKFGLGVMCSFLFIFQFIVSILAVDPFIEVWISYFKEMRGLTIASLVLLIFGIYLIYDAFAGKDRISKEHYNQLRDIRILSALKSNCNYYINDLANSQYEYAFKELCRNYYSLYNEYASSILNQQTYYYNAPISSTTAAYIGTKIGGLAVGLAAAAEAERKKEAYEQNVKEVIASKLAVGSAYDKVKYCYEEMIKIIMTNERTKSDWEHDVMMIDEELNAKYKVK